MIWFDRDDITQLLLKRVESFNAGYRKNLALVGPEAMGKTTLLNRLLQSQRSAPQGPIPFYLELREGESVAEWAQRFVQALLYGVLQVEGVKPLPAEHNELISLSSTRVPRTCAVAARLLDRAQSYRSDEVYDRLWDLPQMVTQELGRGVLVVLDEFDLLQRLPVKDPFKRLGRKIMVQSGSLYLVASSRVHRARSILKEGLSLLFGQFEIIPVGCLAPAASEKAIRSVWPEGQQDPFLEHLLMELVQGHPGNLDLLQQGLMGNCSDAPHPVHEHCVLDLLESLLFNPQGKLRLRFEEQLGRLPAHNNRLLWIQILGAVAAGQHRAGEIAERLDRPPLQINRGLRALEQARLVRRQGVFFRISDQLFQLWMRTTHPIIEGVARVDWAGARVQFRHSLQEWMEAVRRGLNQPMTERVAALMRLWEGEQVEMEGRRTLLPQWERVEGISTCSGESWLAARRPGKTPKGWLVVPWSGSLEEGEARRLLDAFAALPLYKDYRKVLIGAYPVEIHARLILQQARVRLWDLTLLNDLLDLYGLTCIPSPAAASHAPLGATAVPLLERDSTSERSGAAGTETPLQDSGGAA